MSSFSPKFLAATAGLFIFITSPFLRALDSPTSFVINLPFQANEATPLWLGHPVTPSTTFATLDLPIIPPDSTSSLLVTVLFQEQEGGFLRITWQGAQGAQVLSDNFYEGIGMSNQRSLLISAQTLQGQGTLNFQCGGTVLGIQRIKLEWLENQNELVSPQVQDLLVTPAMGPTQPAQNLDGQLKPADSPAWHDLLVNVPITDNPQRIEAGVDFSVELDNVPSSGRLVLKEAGLPFGKHLVVWINQQRAGTITPVVPDLMDDGYLADASGVMTYVGWREGSFSLPVSFLKAGVNTVQFSVEDDVTSPNGPSTAPVLPLAIKDAVLQLDYPPSASQSQASSTPTGPVTPELPSSTSTETNSP